MKVIATKVFGDGKRNYDEGEIISMTKEQIEIINSTPSGILVKEVKESKTKSEEE